MNRFLISRTLRHVVRHHPLVPPLVQPKPRLFCSQPTTEPQPDTKPTSLSDPAPKPDPPVADVGNAEFKRRIEQYLHGNDEQALPSIFEAVLARKLARNHEDTDEELVDEFRFRPRDDITNREFESDFEEMHDTDEDLPDLYNAREYAQHKMAKDEFFNMDDKKWDDMIKEATEQGFLKDTRECEEILEDMLSWDKLLPDEIKRKVEAKFDELGDMCERGEIEPEKAYELFKEFEDQMVLECAKLMEAEQPPEEDAIAGQDKNVELDDPPGEGPILRWESRCVFAPGGDACHPKNRQVKLSVTVKELELSWHAFRRLREVVGKRYHPGRDELTITSERFEHREENMKDCLRTLYALIEDAMKADKSVEETRNAYVKDRLRANPHFMERLKAKAAKKMQGVLPATL